MPSYCPGIVSSQSPGLQDLLERRVGQWQWELHVPSATSLLSKGCPQPQKSLLMADCYLCCKPVDVWL